MSEWIGPVVVILTSILGSSGVWAWLASRKKTDTAMVRLLLGLAYDKIATLGMHYIERGWITREEFEEFHNELYTPYKEFGGNGVAEQIMAQVSRLPFKTHGRYAEVTHINPPDREIA